MPGEISAVDFANYPSKSLAIQARLKTLDKLAVFAPAGKDGLRVVVGDHVFDEGSLVSPENDRRLRGDNGWFTIVSVDDLTSRGIAIPN